MAAKHAALWSGQCADWHALPQYAMRAQEPHELPVLRVSSAPQLPQWRSITKGARGGAGGAARAALQAALCAGQWLAWHSLPQ